MAEPIKASPERGVPRPNPMIEKLRPYQQGAAAVSGHDNPIKLSSNESPFGPSPLALKAYHDAAGQLCRYPDGTQSGLRGAIGEVFDLDPGRIVCGNGSEELQLLLVRAFLRPGDEAIASEYSFIMGRIHAVAQGAKVVVAPEPEYRASAEAILSKVTPKTRMIMLASPNNPVGDYMRADELAHLVANVPPDVVIVYDGAYADYVEAADYDPGFGLVAGAPNLAVTRTFSKLYGLAGLRIGWLYCHEALVDAVQRIRTPFNANVAALAAAEAALRDREFADSVRAHNTRWLKQISDALARVGLPVFPSAANFYLIRFPETGPQTADKAADFLLGRGIIPRPVSAGGPAGCLRITVGTDKENEAVLRALTDFMAQ